MVKGALIGFALLLLLPGASQAAPSCPPQVVDATTLDHKLMMGYQGWFAAKGDGSPLNSWFHWFGEKPIASDAVFDLLPDTSELAANELFPTQMTSADGKPVALYSAYQWPTVARHFKWMRDYGIDGAMVQRFTSELPNPIFFKFRNRVAVYAMAASGYYGRTFCIMYDISGDPNLDESVIKDWKYMVDVIKITGSPRYLHHKGKPLVVVWGIGFKDRPQTIERVQHIVNFFKNDPNPAYHATLMGGVPDGWRDRSGGSRTEPEWGDVYKSLDVISPWTVGGFSGGTEQGVDDYVRLKLQKDLWVTRHNGQDYMPVIWPGFSWHNLKKGPLNQVPRMGGTFYWKQASSFMSAGCTMLYNAMFDEVNEGTAMYKIVPNKAQLPVNSSFLSLDADGKQLPSDWYLRLAGCADQVLRGERSLSSSMPIDPNHPQLSDGMFQCTAGQAGGKP